MLISLDDAFRATGTRFRLYPQPPVLDEDAGPETVWVSSPAGSLGPGPSDLRMYAVSPIGKKPYADTDLPPFRGRAAEPVLPAVHGHFDHLAPDAPGFRPAHMFGTVRRVLDVWEAYLGGPVPWHFSMTHRRLELIPHVAWNNAHFGWGFMECGEGEDDHGVPRPYALNFDVIAHETGHGLLWGLIGAPEPEAMTVAFRGFHESASDCVALIAAMHFPSVLDRVLEDTSGDLYLANELSRIGELSRTRQIRVASNDITMRDVVALSTPALKATGKQVHKLGQPLTGAVFDILVELFLVRLVAFGLLPAEMAQDLRRGAQEQEEDPAGHRRLVDAYASEPEGFRAALAVARDMLGLRLAETWRRTPPGRFGYNRLAGIFLAVDRAMSGDDNEDLIRECFAWRGIRPARADFDVAPGAAFG